MTPNLEQRLQQIAEAQGYSWPAGEIAHAMRLAAANTGKLEAAIIRHESAAQEAKRLKAGIGQAIEKCAISKLDCESREGKYRDEKGRTKTHLWSCLNERVECDSNYYSRLLHPEEIEEALSEECPHCLEAWRLIVKRKAVRQELGAAKRAIRNIGRSLLAKQGAAQ